MSPALRELIAMLLAQIVEEFDAAEQPAEDAPEPAVEEESA